MERVLADTGCSFALNLIVEETNNQKRSPAAAGLSKYQPPKAFLEDDLILLDEDLHVVTASTSNVVVQTEVQQKTEILPWSLQAAEGHPVFVINRTNLPETVIKGENMARGEAWQQNQFRRKRADE